MGKIKIRLRDMEFAHSPISWNSKDIPIHIEWDRNTKDGPNQITVFTDHMLHEMQTSTSKIKIAMLMEPEAINNKSYAFIKNGGYKFATYVLTHHKSLLDVIPNGIRIPGSGSWMKEHQWKIYPKAKKVSIIASHKKRTTGHILRHEIISKFKSSFNDIYGKGSYNTIPDKIIALKDYRYIVVVENIKLDYFFTEKIIDAFATGTVPIYYGCPSIGDFFDTKGIIQFNNFNDIGHILSYIGEKDYNKRLPSIKKNFEIAKSKYKIIEDYIYLNILKGIINK